MARFGVKTVFLASLLLGLLAAKGLCRPDSNEDLYKYANDEETDDGDFDDDDRDDVHNSQPPVMKSTPLVLEVHSGEEVVLPCTTMNATHDMRNFAVTWEKNGRILYVDIIQHGLRDRRITHRISDGTLIVTNVSATDSGHYTCTYSSSPPVGVTHTVNVFAPAAIRSIEPSRSVAVDKGHPVTLKCNVTGYPPPVVEWKKLNKHDHREAVVIAGGENITLNSLERLDSGTYECTAKNRLGPEVSAQVSVRVTYAPEIDIDDELVTSGRDYETKLKCTVYAEPKAKVYWIKDNVSVSDLDHVHTFSEGNKHYYHIQETQVSDFGKYKCIATNIKGTTSSKEIELTGRPSTPDLLGATVGPDGRSLHLEWRIISYSPILEYRVQYRNAKEPGKWQMFETPVQAAEDANVYKLQYQLKDIPVGDFLVTLRARNFYGWTNPAKPHSFTIKNEINAATAETSKLEEGHIQNDSTRPRITALLMIMGLCALVL